MADACFFEALGPASLTALCEATKAGLSDSRYAGREISNAGSLLDAGPDAIAYYAGPKPPERPNAKHVAELGATRAGAVFVAEDALELVPEGCAALVTPWPKAAWALAVNLLLRERRHDAVDGEIHPAAVIEPDVTLGPGVAIGPGARIGRGTVIAARAVIGPGVSIGRNCSVGANASVYFALLGDRVKVLAGARIGEAGFGIASSRQGAVDMPQLGRVILQDGVTIGANSCVDRGSLSDTVIGENSKLDNLCHIAHGVQMGRNCVAAAYLGVSGSCVIGDNVQFGGRSGLRDHISVGQGASLAGGSLVTKDVPAGETWGGYPARPISEWNRREAALAKLVRDRRGDT